MARAPRDYAAEYRRRLERAREQGVTDKAAARGHKSREQENARRRAATEKTRKAREAKDRKNTAARAKRLLLKTIRELAEANYADGIDYDDHGDRYGVVNDTVRERGAVWTLGRLREQRASLDDWIARHGPDDPMGRHWYRRATPAEAPRKWVPRDRSLPEPMYFYHGHY